VLNDKLLIVRIFDCRASQSSLGGDSESSREPPRRNGAAERCCTGDSRWLHHAYKCKGVGIDSTRPRVTIQVQ